MIMRLILNLIWLILCGWWLAVLYMIAGVICAILIITIPFAIASFRIASYVIWPFGRTVVERPGASAAKSGCGNVIWFVVGGWYMALLHFITGLLLCIPIITIPLAIQNFKLAGLALAPFGKEIVSNAEARRRRAAYAAAAVNAPSTATPPPPAPDDVTF